MVEVVKPTRGLDLLPLLSERLESLCQARPTIALPEGGGLWCIQEALFRFLDAFLDTSEIGNRRKFHAFYA